MSLATSHIKPGYLYYSVGYSVGGDAVQSMVDFGIFMCLSNDNGVVAWLNMDGSHAGKTIDIEDYSDYGVNNLDHIKPL